LSEISHGDSDKALEQGLRQVFNTVFINFTKTSLKLTIFGYWGDVDRATLKYTPS
jgi:hypothetical protein